MQRFLLPCLLLWFFLPPLLPAQTRLKPGPFVLPPGSTYWPQRVVFKLKPAYRPAARPTYIDLPGWDEWLLPVGPSTQAKMFPGLQAPRDAFDKYGQPLVDLSTIYTLTYHHAHPVEAVVNHLLAHPAVAYAEPWFIHTPFYQPNDPFADTTGGIDLMWHLDQIWARQAWDVQQGDSSVVVGIVDSGTNTDHPDLQDNLARNRDDLPDGLDNDNDGYVDNYLGWDFGGDTYLGVGDNSPYVFNSHGLHVTGIVGTTADNGIGIPGICFNCGYLPIKAAPDDSIGAIFYGYQGIIYAVEQGADVVNCSWGGPFPSELGRDVVNYATINRRASVVAAAGNSTSDTKFYPAAYERVISVANTTYGDVLFSNSTYNYTVDVAAPGWNIRSTQNSNGYHTWGGTSASAPIVAAAIALTKRRFPHYSGYQAGHRVRITADDIYGVNPTLLRKLGNGRINMFRALSDPARPAIRIEEQNVYDSDRDGIASPGDTLVLDLGFRNLLDSAHNLRISVRAAGFNQNYAQVVDSVFEKGGVSPMALFAAGDALRVRLRPGVPDDFLLALTFTYRDTATGYEDFEVLELRVNNSWVNVTANDLHTTVTSRGDFGFNDFIFQQQGLGIRYRNRRNALFEGGFLVGTNAVQVSDHIRNLSSRDSDFQVVETIHVLETGLRADFEARAVFDDAFALSPLGVTVDYHTYAFAEEGLRDFVLLRYIVTNTQGSPLSPLFGGLFADWEIAPYLSRGSLVTRNTCAYDDSRSLIYAYDRTGADATYYGIALLSPQPFRAYAIPNGSPFAFNGVGKFQALSNLPTPGTAAAGLTGGGADVMQFIGAGIGTLPAGRSDTLVFALLAGPNLNGLFNVQAAAAEAYRCRILGQGPDQTFAVSDTLLPAGGELQVTDQNPGASAWTWDFGDGNTATGAQAVHSFASPGTYTVQLTVEQAGCTARFTRTVSVSATNALATRPEPRLRVFPNPSAGHVTLEGAVRGPVVLTLTDLQGRRLRQETRLLHGQPVVLDLSPLASGTYLLHLRGTGWQEVHRVHRLP